MTDDDKAFYAGFSCAVATLIRTFDEPSMAADICKSNGVTLEQLRRAGIDKFDLEPITKAMKP